MNGSVIEHQAGRLWIYEIARDWPDYVRRTADNGTKNMGKVTKDYTYVAYIRLVKYLKV